MDRGRKPEVLDVLQEGGLMNEIVADQQEPHWQTRVPKHFDCIQQHVDLLVRADRSKTANDKVSMWYAGGAAQSLYGICRMLHCRGSIPESHRECKDRRIRIFLTQECGRIRIVRNHQPRGTNDSSIQTCQVRRLVPGN